MTEETALRLAGHLKPSYPLIHNAYQDVAVDCEVKLHAALQQAMDNRYGGKVLPHYSPSAHRFLDGAVGHWDIQETLLGTPMEDDRTTDGMCYQRLAVSSSFDCQDELGLTYSPALLSMALAPVKYMPVSQIMAYRIPDEPDELAIAFDTDALCVYDDEEQLYDTSDYLSDCASILSYFQAALGGKYSDSGLLKTKDGIFVSEYVEETCDAIREKIFPAVSARDFLKIAPVVLDFLCDFNTLDSLGMDEPAVAWMFSSSTLLDYIRWREHHTEVSGMLSAMDSAVSVLRAPFREAETEAEQKKFNILTGEVIGEDAYLFYAVSNDLNDYSCSPYFQAAREIFETLYPRFLAEYR